MIDNPLSKGIVHNPYLVMVVDQFLWFYFHYLTADPKNICNTLHLPVFYTQIILEIFLDMLVSSHLFRVIKRAVAILDIRIESSAIQYLAVRLFRTFSLIRVR